MNNPALRAVSRTCTPSASRLTGNASTAATCRQRLSRRACDRIHSLRTDRPSRRQRPILQTPRRIGPSSGRPRPAWTCAQRPGHPDGMTTDYPSTTQEEDGGELRGGRAVTPASDEGIESGDEGLHVDGKVPLAFDYSTKDLLDFQVLLADAHVELSETLFIDAVLLPEQAHHLLARLSRGKSLETRDQRDLEVGKARPHLALEFGKPGPEPLLGVRTRSAGPRGPCSG